MKKPRSFFYLLSCFALFPSGRAIAQDIKIQPCSFNGGRWIQTRFIREGKGFRLDWSDGPKMTYTLASGDNAVIQYLDSLGGRWRYSASSANKGFTLYNPKNGNKIVCDSQSSAHSTTISQLPGITKPQLASLNALGIKVAVPGYIPKGFRVVNVTTQCPGGTLKTCRQGPTYDIVFRSPAGICFVIEGTSGGIGDTFLEQPVTVKSELFGPIKIGLNNSGSPIRSDANIIPIFTEWLTQSLRSGPVYRFYSGEPYPAGCTSKVAFNEAVKIVESLKWLF
jgi:hypothetical protein